MEVKINKEIRNYTESMFFGLSLREFIFSVLTCGVAVGLSIYIFPTVVLMILLLLRLLLLPVHPGDIQYQ